MLTLEEFSDLATEPATAGAIAPDRCAPAYESGYNAGWEDAANALGQTRLAEIEAIGSALQDHDFLLAEARQQLLGGLETVLPSLFATLLPEIAHHALVPLLAERIDRIAAEATETEIRVAVAPSRLAEVEDRFVGTTARRLALRADSGLSPGMARIEFGTRSLVIDPAKAAELMLAAVNDFFALSTRKDVAHG